MDKNVTIDDRGMVLLPNSLRKQVGWQIGDTLMAKYNSTSNALDIALHEGGTLIIDSLGRVALPSAVRDALGWLSISAFDKVKIFANGEKLSLVCDVN